MIRLGIGSGLFGPAQSMARHERGGSGRHYTENRAMLGLPTRHVGQHDITRLSRPCSGDTTQNRPVGPEDGMACGRACRPKGGTAYGTSAGHAACRGTGEAVATAIVIAGVSPA